jgi:hypothetical protein
LQEFGREEGLRMVSAAPGLLAIRTAVWRRALAVWGLCGVADPRAVAVNCAQTVYQDWLRPSIQANLLALQRYLPWQPSAAEVIEQFASYVSTYAVKRLAGRLLFLEQAGLLPLLVVDKRVARQEWRQQQGLLVSKKTAGEPLFVSVLQCGYSERCSLRTAGTAAERAQRQLGGVQGQLGAAVCLAAADGGCGGGNGTAPASAAFGSAASNKGGCPGER